MTSPPALPIAQLTRRLAECPPDFLAEPQLGGAVGVPVHAVVSDLLENLGGPPLSPFQAGTFMASGPMAKQRRNILRLVLIAAWLCADPALPPVPGMAAIILAFLSESLEPLARLTAADLFVSDPDRREELARLLLSALHLVPQGETPAQAADRLKALSTVERARVVQETRRQQENARKLQEAMRRQAALEAAAKVQRE